MNTKCIKLNEFEFKFEDIDIVYPSYLYSKFTGKYCNFKRIMVDSKYSRKYQLEHRSTQSKIFDLLIKINHFNSIGIDDEIIREFPLINTRKDIDNDRNYYLLDYFIPSKSLCIELDSGLHNSGRDKTKDEFLNSLGIEVLRVNDFHIDTESKLDKIVKWIKLHDEKKFEVDYSELTKQYLEFNNQIVIESESMVKSIMSTEVMRDRLENLKRIYPPTRAEKIAILSILDSNLYFHAIKKEKYSFSLNLNDLFLVMRRYKKKKDSYKALIHTLSRYNLHLTVLRDKDFKEHKNENDREVNC